MAQSFSSNMHHQDTRRGQWSVLPMVVGQGRVAGSPTLTQNTGVQAPRTPSTGYFGVHTSPMFPWPLSPPFHSQSLSGAPEPLPGPLY